jgi:hypothetical protein
VDSDRCRPGWQAMGRIVVSHGALLGIMVLALVVLLITAVT